jgi:hypothetical protein
MARPRSAAARKINFAYLTAAPFHAPKFRKRRGAQCRASLSLPRAIGVEVTVVSRRVPRPCLLRGVAMPQARANGIDIEYESFGRDSDPLILVIMGLAAQLVFWPKSLCEGLAAKEFRVVRFDNRDIG